MNITEILSRCPDDISDFEKSAIINVYLENLRLHENHRKSLLPLRMELLSAQPALTTLDNTTRANSCIRCRLPFSSLRKVDVCMKCRDMVCSQCKVPSHTISGKVYSLCTLCEKQRLHDSYSGQWLKNYSKKNTCESKDVFQSQNNPLITACENFVTDMTNSSTSTFEEVFQENCVRLEKNLYGNVTDARSDHTEINGEGFQKNCNQHDKVSLALPKQSSNITKKPSNENTTSQKVPKIKISTSVDGLVSTSFEEVFQENCIKLEKLKYDSDTDARSDQTEINGEDFQENYNQCDKFSLALPEQFHDITKTPSNENTTSQKVPKIKISTSVDGLVPTSESELSNNTMPRNETLLHRVRSKSMECSSVIPTNILLEHIRKESILPKQELAVQSHVKTFYDGKTDSGKLKVAIEACTLRGSTVDIATSRICQFVGCLLPRENALLVYSKSAQLSQKNDALRLELEIPIHSDDPSQYSIHLSIWLLSISVANSGTRLRDAKSSVRRALLGEAIYSYSDFMWLGAGLRRLPLYRSVKEFPKEHASGAITIILRLHSARVINYKVTNRILDHKLKSGRRSTEDHICLKILRISNLLLPDGFKKLHIFCRIRMLPIKSEVFKTKTEQVEFENYDFKYGGKISNLEWPEMHQQICLSDVNRSELAGGRCLELSVINKVRGGSFLKTRSSLKTILGVIRLGSLASFDSTREEGSAWLAMINYPDTDVKITIPMRPNETQLMNIL